MPWASQVWAAVDLANNSCQIRFRTNAAGRPSLTNERVPRPLWECPLGRKADLMLRWGKVRLQRQMLDISVKEIKRRRVSSQSTSRTQRKL
jgi:hypothetical protein